MKNIMKGCLIASAVVIFLWIGMLFISVFFISRDKQQKNTTESIEDTKTPEELLNEQKQILETELQSFSKPFDNTHFRNSVVALRGEIVLFSAWAEAIKRAEESDNVEINKLAKKLKEKVVALQVKEFPMLRKEYAKIINKNLWENDIDVYTNGDKNQYINFTGATFAANKNKKDFQNELHKNLKIFRFNQSRYRWHKGQGEYTYWTIYDGKDSDLVIIQ